MSEAVSAQYAARCPTCRAAPFTPCLTKWSRRTTDTHAARLTARPLDPEPGSTAARIAEKCGDGHLTTAQAIQAAYDAGWEAGMDDGGSASDGRNDNANAARAHVAAVLREQIDGAL